MSVRLVAKIRVAQVDGKDAEDDAILFVEGDDGDETRLVFWDGKDKKFEITLEKDELLEAVARVSGGDIRLVDQPKGDY